MLPRPGSFQFQLWFGAMKPAAIWKVWSLTWLVSTTAVEGNRVQAMAVYPLYCFVLIVIWAQGGLYSLRSEALVSVISPKEKRGTTARFVLVLMSIVLPLTMAAVWLQSSLEIPVSVVFLIYFSVALLLLAPGIFWAIGSGELAVEMESIRVIREWSKSRKVKPYYLPHFVTRRNVMTPEALQLFLDVYGEVVPEGAPVALLTEHEELGDLFQVRLGLSRLSSKEQPTMAFAGFKQEQRQAPN